MRLLSIIIVLLASVVPVVAQTRAEASAEVLRTLQASRPPRVMTARPTDLHRVVIVHQPAPVAPAPLPVARRLDGTRVSDPPLVDGFTPNDWQWWYQWEVHR